MGAKRYRPERVDPRDRQVDEAWEHQRERSGLDSLARLVQACAQAEMIPDDNASFYEDEDAPERLAPRRRERGLI